MKNEYTISVKLGTELITLIGGIMADNDDLAISVALAFVQSNFEAMCLHASELPSLTYTVKTIK